jgi:hypothetical protein
VSRGFNTGTAGFSPRMVPYPEIDTPWLPSTSVMSLGILSKRHQTINAIDPFPSIV